MDLPRSRRRLVAAAALLALALMLVFGPPWLRLLAAAAAVIAAAWRWQGPLGAWMSRNRADLLCGAALLVVTFVMVWPASVGERPVSYDHTIHYTKAWQLHQHLSQGRLWGWVGHWMGGYPLGFNYPLGGDLWVNVVHAALLGLVSLSQAYGLAVFLMYFLLALSVFLLGARCINRGVGMLAALMLVMENGQIMIAGWTWIMIWGVWPCALSVALSLLALAHVPRLREGGPGADRAAVTTALLVGAAVLAHPLQLIHLGLMVPMAMALYLSAAPRRVALPASARLGGAALIGLGLAAWWLLPFISAGQDQVRESLLWLTWDQMGEHLAEAKPIPQLWGYVSALGAVGCLALVLTNRLRGLLIGVPAFMLMVLGASSFYHGVGLRQISEAFAFIHYPRFAMLAQPYLCLGAAYVVRAAVSRAWSPWAERAARRKIGWRRPLRLALALGLTLPVLIPAGSSLLENRVLRDVDTDAERVDGPSRADLVKWLEKRRKADPRFFRFALDRSLGDLHHHADLVTLTQVPMYKTGHTPAVQFRNRSEQLNRATARALNVRYVVTKASAVRLSGLKRVANAGKWTIYEDPGWSPDLFATERNPRAVKLLRRDANEVVLRVSRGVGRLRLNVADFSRWFAYRDGQPVEIKPVRPRGVQIQLITVDASTPGTYTFRYEACPEEYIGAALSLAALLLLAGAVVWWRTRRDHPNNGEDVA